MRSQLFYQGCPGTCSTGVSSDTWCIQGETVGDLEHGTEHSGIPMAPADARPPSITRLPAPSTSPPPPEPGTSNNTVDL